ncbi:hypothetical protein P691DRAFT_766020 [Macrolepiota fuliginosa MF-IS2]|uniref:Uncharacterized protein n=1 Tax=Macrolepiota fuliginosa MF-IS2 TaxID=1400762 RepID=A0A9P6BVD4_9AGAR|nr:hypothetical protein P691DRAFT_766020 [Macrolepiota fuliginosa MF-IS2]
MAQPQTAKPPKINPFKGDPHHFQTFQDKLRLIFDGYSTAFQDAQGNPDDRKKIIYTLQNMTDGNAAGFQNSFMKKHWDNTNNCYNYGSWTNFNNILEENFKPKIKATQAIEHLKHARLDPKTTDIAVFNQTFTYLLNQIFLTTQTPDSYVAWQQDIANLINNFQKYKLCNSSLKYQTPISFYGNALNDQKKKFVYQE